MADLVYLRELTESQRLDRTCDIRDVDKRRFCTNPAVVEVKRNRKGKEDLAPNVGDEDHLGCFCIEHANEVKANGGHTS